MNKITIDIEGAYNELKEVSGIKVNDAMEVSAEIKLTDGGVKEKIEWKVYFSTKLGKTKWTDTHPTFDECVTEIKTFIKDSESQNRSL